MSPWKVLLLSLYYHGSYPTRAREMARRCAEGTAPVFVMFYHRIADDGVGSWTESNRMFRRQIDWLGKRCDFISLAEAQNRLRSGRNDRPAVAITFDDGYASNCDQALPLLIERAIPCTYFVSSRHVLDAQPFPHDVANGRPLAVNTPEQIRAMSDAGIEIGAHTRTHADIGRITSDAQLRDEVLGSREDLQELTGRPVRYFAFPYGQHVNLSPAAFELAREEGFEGVCSAYGGYNFPGDDPFHLQRIHGDEDFLRLKNWITLDPRKLRKTERYAYREQASSIAVEPVGALS